MPEIADIVFRSITVMAVLLLAGLLAATRRRREAALPGALFCLAVAAFFVTSVPGIHPSLGAWSWPLTALCVTKAVWFWLFARALFADSAALDLRHFGIAGGVAIAGSWQQLVFLPLYRAGGATAWETILGFGFDGVLLVFVLMGLHAAWRDMAVDLVERRRQLRVAFMAAAATYLALTLGFQAVNLLLDISTPLLVMRANMAIVTAAGLTAAWLLLQPRPEREQPDQGQQRRWQTVDCGPAVYEHERRSGSAVFRRRDRRRRHYGSVPLSRSNRDRKE